MDHIPKIIIRTINPSNHRYPTCGDWLYDAEDHVLEIRVSLMPDFRSELAVAIHEAVEAVMCLKRDISETDVTAFDLKFEEERGEGKHTETDEPGDDKRAPYFDEHVAATFVEREVCTQSKIAWSEHEKNVYES
jgi:hypothetical protein